MSLTVTSTTAPRKANTRTVSTPPGPARRNAGTTAVVAASTPSTPARTSTLPRTKVHASLATVLNTVPLLDDQELPRVWPGLRQEQAAILGVQAVDVAERRVSSEPE